MSKREKEKYEKRKNDKKKKKIKESGFKKNQPGFSVYARKIFKGA